MTARTAPGPAKANPARKRKVWPKVVLWAAAVVIVGLIGYVVRLALEPADHQVTVSRTFSGTISQVNPQGTAGCVKPTNGGSPICSALYTTTKPKLGDKVSAALEDVHVSDGSYTMLVLYSPPHG